MKLLIHLFAVALIVTVSSCTRIYYDDVLEDLEGGNADFDFIALAASADSVDMYEPVTITAVAMGNNLTYKWERAKGSLVKDNESGSIVQFWGCNTCFFWLTVRCTVSNESGSKSKEVYIYVRHPMEEKLKEMGVWEEFLIRYGLL